MLNKKPVNFPLFYVFPGEEILTLIRCGLLTFIAYFREPPGNSLTCYKVLYVFCTSIKADCSSDSADYVSDSLKISNPGWYPISFWSLVVQLLVKKSGTSNILVSILSTSLIESFAGRCFLQRSRLFWFFDC